MTAQRQAKTRQVVVLGLGNILLQDEGLGVRAVERLKDRYVLPEHVQALDGGTLGLDLLPYIAGATDLLILDAVDVDRAPGTVVRLVGDSIPAALSLKMSMHQVGVQELLGASRLRGILPRNVVVWGMQPAALDWGLDLTEPIKSELDKLVTKAAEELQSWGIKLDPVQAPDNTEVKNYA